jgi:hypothetical protein
VYARRRYISYTFNKQDIASAYLRTGRQGPRGDVNPLAGQLPPTVVIPFGNSSRRGRRLGRRSTQITHFYSTPITSTSICTAITARLRVSHNVFASPPTA